MTHATDDASTDDATTGDAAETPDAQDVEEAVDDLANDVAADAEAAVEDIVDGLEEVQASEGGGGATFSVNGETWEFPSVLCAFGEDEIGQPGGVFNMSAINDGLQLYASIDDSGAAHSLSLNDIEDFENPSVSLAMSGLVAGAFGVSPEFLTLDGKNVSASVVMVDENTNVPTDAPAEFTATCP